MRVKNRTCEIERRLECEYDGEKQRGGGGRGGTTYLEIIVILFVGPLLILFNLLANLRVF